MYRVRVGVRRVKPLGKTRKVKLRKLCYIIHGQGILIHLTTKLLSLSATTIPKTVWNYGTVEEMEVLTHEEKQRNVQSHCTRHWFTTHIVPPPPWPTRVACCSQCATRRTGGSHIAIPDQKILVPVDKAMWSTWTSLPRYQGECGLVEIFLWVFFSDVFTLQEDKREAMNCNKTTHAKL